MNFVSLLPKKSVNIDFSNIVFSIQGFNNKSKIILNGISGSFKSGQLSAILGPSGAGKTTLLNILARYKLEQTSGTILINGEIKDKKDFGKISRYIMQENAMQTLITVKEMMMIAAHLKLGNNASNEEKEKIITEILNSLRLLSNENTQTEQLSGGEIKRLVIALELINNPAVLFLDEPTTGLDETSSYLCIKLLKELANNGKTVICTIHSPSARLFSCFDNSYFMSSNGQCVYHGSGSYLVPYLSGVGIECPIQYNPADFVIELCFGNYLKHQEKMVDVIENGQNIYQNGQFYKLKREEIREKPRKTKDEKFNQTSGWMQFKILLLRMWLFQFRNKKVLIIKILFSLVLGILTGGVFYNAASDATKMIFNYNLHYYCIVIYHFMPLLPLLQKIPLEICYVKREYFNGWYKLKPYVFALTFSTLPDQFIFAMFFSTPLLVLTGQSFELTRILGFYLVCFLTALIAEGYALIMASLMNIVNSTFVGAVSTIPFVILPVIASGMEFATIPLLYKICIYSSHLRYSFEISVLVMLQGKVFKCPENVDFCMLKNVEYFFKIMSFDHAVVSINFIVLIAVFIVIKFIGYYFLKHRLNSKKWFKCVRK